MGSDSSHCEVVARIFETAEEGLYRSGGFLLNHRLSGNYPENGVLSGWPLRCSLPSEAEIKAAVPNSAIRLDSGNPAKTSVSQYQTAHPDRFPSGSFRPSSQHAVRDDGRKLPDR